MLKVFIFLQFVTKADSRNFLNLVTAVFRVVKNFKAKNLHFCNYAPPADHHGHFSLCISFLYARPHSLSVSVVIPFSKPSSVRVSKSKKKKRGARTVDLLSISLSLLISYFTVRSQGRSRTI